MTAENTAEMAVQGQEADGFLDQPLDEALLNIFPQTIRAIALALLGAPAAIEVKVRDIERVAEENGPHPDLMEVIVDLRDALFKILRQLVNSKLIALSDRISDCQKIVRILVKAVEDSCIDARSAVDICDAVHQDVVNFFVDAEKMRSAEKEEETQRTLVQARRVAYQSGVEAGNEEERKRILRRGKSRKKRTR